MTYKAIKKTKLLDKIFKDKALPQKVLFDPT